MSRSDRTNRPSTGRRNALWPPAFLLLLALLQLALVPPLSGDIELAPLFRADSLGILFGTAWTLALAAISFPLAEQSEGLRIDLFLGLIGVGLLVCAYAQNMVVLAAGWALAGVGIWAIRNVLGAPAETDRPLLAALAPAMVIAILAAATGFPEFAPPAGGMAGPWEHVAVMAGGLVAASSIGWRLQYGPEGALAETGQAAGATLAALYALAAPYTLAKMLVAAPWHPIGAWLLVLLGMVAVLIGVYVAYVSQRQQRNKAVAGVLVGTSMVGFGIAANSPLAATGATWVMLLGLFWTVAGGWRWAEVVALMAVLPGVWMVSQAALDTGYGVVAALLLPAYILLAGLVSLRGHTAQGALTRLRWIGATSVAFTLAAVAMPQLVVETMLRPAVRTMAGGVGALTSLEADWGVGILVRTVQGTVPAALPATGIALAVFLAAVVLYWLKQLARFAARRVDGETQAE